jgi:hypothetical protein
MDKRLLKPVTGFDVRHEKKTDIIPPDNSDLGIVQYLEIRGVNILPGPVGRQPFPYIPIRRGAI